MSPCPCYVVKKWWKYSSRALLHAPAWPEGKSPFKKREQRNHHCGRDPESHQEDVGSMLLDLPGRVH